METRRSYCRLCQALCGILVTTEGERVVDVTGDPGNPLSEGYTCPKGRSLPALHHHPDRLAHPALGRGADRRVEAWPAVLDDLADRLRTIVGESGPDAIGMYVGTGSSFDGAGRSTTRRFMRAIGSRSYYSSGTVDSPCKPLVAELVAGHAAVIPHIGPHTPLTLLVGLNPVVSHGHLQSMPNPRRRLQRWSAQGELWVVDPRRTESAAMADRHLAPRPGTDPVWLAAVVRELLTRVDLEELRGRTTGLEALRAAVEPFDLEGSARRCGVGAQDLADLVAAIHRAGKLGFEAGTGMTMTPGANVAHWLLWVLCVITDSMDHPEGMWCNPGLLHSFDRLALVPTDGRAGPGPASRPDLPERVGELPSAAIVDEVEAGNLRALLVVGGNPMTALPDAPRLSAALSSLDVLAVADVLPGATVDLATHVLPVTDQLERADIPWFDTILPALAAQYTPALVSPTGEARDAWWVLGQLGVRMGLDVLAGHDPDTATTEDLLALMARRGRVSLADLQAADGPIIDPDMPLGWVRDILPAGGWRLAPEELVAQLADHRPAADVRGDRLPEEDASAGRPLVLAPSRQLRHLNSLLAGAPTADGREEVPRVVLHPDDARARGLRDGATVRVASATGAVEAILAISDAMKPGAVTLPHGYDGPNVNDLTTGASVDPLTGMPTYSALPVEVAPVGVGPVGVGPVGVGPVGVGPVGDPAAGGGDPSASGA